MNLETYPPMTVSRVAHANGTHIEPPMGDDWSQLAKLRWEAGVVKADTGVQIDVTPQSQWPEEFALSYPNGSIAAYPFKEAWVFLTGFSVGWRVCRRSEGAETL